MNFGVYKVHVSVQVQCKLQINRCINDHLRYIPYNRQIAGTSFHGTHTMIMVYKISPNNLRNFIGKLKCMKFRDLVLTIS